MVLVPVEKNVLYEVKLDYPLVVVLSDDENEPREEITVLEQRCDRVVLVGERTQSEAVEVLLPVVFFLEYLVRVHELG